LLAVARRALPARFATVFFALALRAGLAFFFATLAMLFLSLYLIVLSLFLPKNESLLLEGKRMSFNR
jgi:hypothetical protein